MRKKREKEKKKGIKGNRKGELKGGREIGKGDRTRGGWGRGGKVNGDKKGMGKENAISQYL